MRLKRGKLKVEITISSLEIAEQERGEGAGRLFDNAHKLLMGESLPQGLPEHETANARSLVRDMEAGLELHGKTQGQPEKESQQLLNHD